MKPKEQRIAIGEACGIHIPPCHKNNGLYRDLVMPDYLNDLNEMHTAEKVLTDEQAHRYEMHLVESFTYPTMATAAQRAEAFLRTLGKWEDS